MHPSPELMKRLLHQTARMTEKLTSGVFSGGEEDRVKRNCGTTRFAKDFNYSDILEHSLHSAAMCLADKGCIDKPISDGPPRAEVQASATALGLL
jgi:hypothetical protein